jgi:hypothetical protein
MRKPHGLAPAVQRHPHNLLGDKRDKRGSWPFIGMQGMAGMTQIAKHAQAARSSTELANSKMQFETRKKAV